MTLTRSLAAAATVTLLLAGAQAASGSPLSTDSPHAGPARPPVAAPRGEPQAGVVLLKSVSAVSADDAWTVGFTSEGSGYIAHWDGSAWNQVASPKVGIGDYLYGVDALSSDDAWAVGTFKPKGLPLRVLVEHWDGSTWTRITTPSAAHKQILYSVSAVSSDDVWAVGVALLGGKDFYGTIVWHWDGTAWRQVKAPRVTASSELDAVSADASDDAWAVGTFVDSSGSRTLVEHWDGAHWAHVRSRDPGSSEAYELLGVTALGNDNVWAVGEGYLPTKAISEHWTGSGWNSVHPHNPQGLDNVFIGTDATSASDVWATGSSGGGVLIEHWNGQKWSVVSSPSCAAYCELRSVSAVSPTDAWAIGGQEGDTSPLVEHWDGTSWTLVSLQP